MLRVDLSKSYLKRTIRPLYAFKSSTPKGMFLDPAWDRSVPVWPGMVAMRTSGTGTVTLINGTGYPYGLFGNYIGGDGIDELTSSGVNACGVWVLGPSAEMEILAPAFDVTSINAALDPVDGTTVLLFAGTTGATRGKLVAAGATGASSRPVCRLLSVESATSIIVGGLVGTTS